MDKRRFSIWSVGPKQIVVALVLVLSATALLPTTLSAQVNEADKERIIRQVAEYWIQVGARQYERGLYTHAQKSLQNALAYEQYLTAEQISKLGRLLQKVTETAGQRAQILQRIRAANDLIKQNRLIEAREHLETVRYNQYLTADERRQVMAGLAKINEALDQQKRQITELYDRGMDFYRSLAEAKTQLEKLADNEFLTDIERAEITASLSRVDFRLTRELERVTELYNLSMEHFNAGQFEQAQSCLAQMKTILTGGGEPSLLTEVVPALTPEEQEPTVIERELLGVMGEEAEPAEKQPDVVDTPELFIIDVVEEPNKPALIDAAEPALAEPAPQAAGRKADMLRSYTTAVVDDAVQKVQDYVVQGQFEQARNIVQEAEQTVSENQGYLGEELFVQYRARLRQLRRQIAEREDAARQ